MAEAIFYLLSIVAIVGGIGVVTTQNVVHAALWLILSLLAVAGFYILLTSEFLALVQVLIYGGAIATIILFGLMLTRGRDLMPITFGENQRLPGLLAGFTLLVVLFAAILNTDWPRYAQEVTVVPLQAIGDELFTTWLLPFEIASAVLLIALIGAIVISRQEEGEA
jgi:NADH-quinone oxidoreductase subunit J